jgi:hypothetical protein
MAFKMKGNPMQRNFGIESPTNKNKEKKTTTKNEEKKNTTTVPFNIEEYPSTMSVIDQVTRQHDKKNRSKHDKTVEWKRPTRIYEQNK